MRRENRFIYLFFVSAILSILLISCGEKKTDVAPESTSTTTEQNAV